VKSADFLHHEDEMLGRALRELEVPEHMPGFHADLREQLDWERFVLDDITWRQRRRSLRRRLAAAAATATAAIVAFVVIGVGLPGGSPGGPEEATAGDVRAAVARALSSAESLSGRIVSRGDDPATDRVAESRWSFAITARGDFRLTGITHRTDLAYDARANVQSYSDETSFSTRSGLAPGWPDSDAPDWIVQRNLESVAAALAEAKDPRVKEVDYRGRPAWRLRVTQADVREITIDQATGIPVRETYFVEGEQVNEWRIDDLSVNAALPADAFEIEPRPGQELSRLDEGFRPTALADVGKAVGYDPLVPRWVPTGYALGDVSVAESARPTGSSEQTNPRSRGVVSLAYGRGLDMLVVTSRLLGADRSRWSDPFAVEDLADPPELVTFATGALARQRGELVVDPSAVPHIWGMTDNLVVTVAGPLTRSELLRVAESLA